MTVNQLNNIVSTTDRHFKSEAALCVLIKPAYDVSKGASIDSLIARCRALNLRYILIEQAKGASLFSFLYTIKDRLKGLSCSKFFFCDIYKYGSLLSCYFSKAGAETILCEEGVGMYRVCVEDKLPLLLRPNSSGRKVTRILSFFVNKVLSRSLVVRLASLLPFYSVKYFSRPFVVDYLSVYAASAIGERIKAREVLPFLIAPPKVDDRNIDILDDVKSAEHVYFASQPILYASNDSIDKLEAKLRVIAAKGPRLYAIPHPRDSENNICVLNSLNIENFEVLILPCSQAIETVVSHTKPFELYAYTSSCLLYCASMTRCVRLNIVSNDISWEEDLSRLIFTKLLPGGEGEASV
ncbi:hypothetical protein EDC56_2302 [Sinobacterium caligoides]|uniref:Uncharacterized protein n=1 Tax=Sinobacterium caligoides TaxID=933926 RepID=A0A3N2DPZ1_9GAMM|nr:polysialyltransferase family glycosyltransferase [Sinobacterium caligoides]ROS01853.1 hypothetical protein EDC56_2302 [Sinobacterium caligoides]